jgi:hypothetical protein
MSTPLIVRLSISPEMSTSTSSDATHDNAAQGDIAEAGIGEVDDSQLGAAEVDALEPGAPQVRMNELGHARDAIGANRQSDRAHHPT